MSLLLLRPCLVLVLVLGACGAPSGQVTVANHLQDAAPPVARKLLLVTEGNMQLEDALLVERSGEYDKVTPAELDAMPATKLVGYSVVILDSHTPTARLRIPALYFDPKGEHAPFRIRARAAHPRVLATAENHQVMRWVTLSDARFDDASVFGLDATRGDTALATIEGGAMIAAGTISGYRVVACGFGLDSTDLALRVAFPMLLWNALDWLEGRPPRDAKQPR